MPLPFKRYRSRKTSDVDAAVTKLKLLYKEYAARYGGKAFNLHAFEHRYHDALVNKVNLHTFLHAEIGVFEELRKRVEISDKGEQGPSYSEVADRIIENNLQKIRKYRHVNFHPDAEEETKHLLGAATDFYYKNWSRINRLLKPLGLKSISDLLYNLEDDFSYFVVPLRSSYSRAVDDYTLVLGRKNPKDSERASYNFIKYGALLLNNCLKLVNDGLNFMGAEARFEAQAVELEQQKTALVHIIDDFRLADIRGY